MKNPSRRQAEPGFEQMSFLPEPDFNPLWPTPNTLPAQCLSLFLDRQTLTHPQFEDITKSWRLSAVVFTLKGLGWPISSHDVPAPTKDAPDRQISRYYLSEKVINAVLGGAGHE